MTNAGETSGNPDCMMDCEVKLKNGMSLSSLFPSLPNSFTQGLRAFKYCGTCTGVTVLRYFPCTRVGSTAVFGEGGASTARSTANHQSDASGTGDTLACGSPEAGKGNWERNCESFKNI